MNNNNNFADLKDRYSNYNESKIVIIPVPYDETSTWIKGADKGPQAIIDCSHTLELYDIETGFEVYKKGIFTDKPVLEKSSPEKMVKSVKQRVDFHLKNNKFNVILGGEHSITTGSILSYSEHFDNISVLQFDAHTDLRDEYEGSKYNHACVMARVKEICPFVQVGIRSMDVSELKSINYDKIFFAENIMRNNNKNKLHQKIIKNLTNNVYITIDLDVFDPSIMPSTGTPEPGGLMWYDVIDLLKSVSEEKNIIGFDVVELCPNKINKSPDYTAAKLIYKTLSYIHC